MENNKTLKITVEKFSKNLEVMYDGSKKKLSPAEQKAVDDCWTDVVAQHPDMYRGNFFSIKAIEETQQKLKIIFSATDNSLDISKSILRETQEELGNSITLSAVINAKKYIAKIYRTADKCSILIFHIIKTELTSKTLAKKLSEHNAEIVERRKTDPHIEKPELKRLVFIKNNSVAVKEFLSRNKFPIKDFTVKALEIASANN
jgi:hypothetical protein